METIVFVLLFGIGAIFGSFLNAAVWRTREEKNITYERSECIHCNTTLRWFELIPIFSFVLQRGKCRSCLQSISWQYPIVELSTGLLFVLAAYMRGGVDMLLLRDLIAILVLTFIFIYDLKYQLILDRISLPAVAVVLCFNLYLFPTAWTSFLLGGLIGGGFFLLQFVVSKGRWIGGGDIRLGLLMGVLLGWKLVLVALLFAYIVGAIVSIILVAMKKKTMASTTPFGTYLTGATLVVLFLGSSMLDWYLSLFI